MVLFETEHCKFIYDKEAKLLYQHWKGFIKPKNFEGFIDKLMEIAREKKIVYLISDATKSEILREESRNYAASVMPELIQLGLKKMAFVMPEKVFVEMTVRDFTDRSERATSDDGIIREFASLDRAKEWLFEK